MGGYSSKPAPEFDPEVLAVARAPPDEPVFDRRTGAALLSCDPLVFPLVKRATAAVKAEDVERLKLWGTRRGLAA